MEAQPFGMTPEMDPMMAAAPAEAAPEAQVIEIDRAQSLKEAHAWGLDFIKRSRAWREASFEKNWLRWARNSDSNYDEALSKKKEPWQSRVVWPMTAAHRENAMAEQFKTEVGPRPPFDVKAREGIVPPEEVAPGADQSKNIKDLVSRERDKSEYEIGRNSQIDDKSRYGSGFAQIFFETDIQDRLTQEPVYEQVQMPWSDGGASLGRSLAGQPQITGYQPVVKPSVIYRGVRFRHISIWDVYPDPQALKVEGHPIGIRYRTTFEEILNGSKEQADGSPGWVLPEAIEVLKTAPSQENIPADKQTIQSDRGISEGKIERPDYAREFECYEVQARLPKKWVLINGEDIDDPEALMSAKLRFHESTIISIFPSESYDGEPDIYKDDYMPVAGQFYGMGVPEMLKDCQDIATETVCQRLDAGAISLKKIFAVIEKCIVDPKDFNNISNGGVLRMKGTDGLTNIDQLFKAVDMGSVDRTAFIEPQEWERIGEARTSITKTTQGVEDNSDTTLGAQKIQQQVTGGKMAYLGMLSEFGFQRKCFNAYLKLIYQNYTPEDYAMALGPERAQTVTPVSPEQFALAYNYQPLGVFELEKKGSRQAGLANWAGQFAQYPWANIVENAREQARAMDIAPERLILPEADALQIVGKAEQMAQGMAQQMVDQAAPKGPPK